jgi:hypothetical protein
MERLTLYDRVTKWGVAHPLVGVLILVAVVVGGIGQALGGFREIWQTVREVTSAPHTTSPEASPPANISVRNLMLNQPAFELSTVTGVAKVRWDGLFGIANNSPEAVSLAGVRPQYREVQHDGATWQLRWESSTMLARG